MAISNQTPLIHLNGLSKSFGKNEVLRSICFTGFPGEVVSIMGENGAGKSTLLKILTGIWPVGSFGGEFQIRSEFARFQSASDAIESGIAMIHQELSLFPELTVAEHLELTRLGRWIDWNLIFSKTQDFLDECGFDISSRAKVSTLSIGKQQLVEIARALYKGAKVVIFDEPTSALSDEEVLQLYRLIKKLRDEGSFLFYVSHRMDEVFEVSDRIIVLRDGVLVGEVSRGDSKWDRKKIEPKLLHWMVGREISDLFPKGKKSVARSPEKVKPILEFLDFSLIDPNEKRKPIKLQNVSFSVRPGEIVGVGGLLGAGRTELLESIFGVYCEKTPLKHFSFKGMIRYQGQDLLPSEPTESLKKGIALLTEDRKKTGLNLCGTVMDNFMISKLAVANEEKKTPVSPSTKWPDYPSSGSMFKTTYQFWKNALKIRAESSSQKVGELSGGNQQKVLLARWLGVEPKLLLLDEPTRGVDVGAKVEIYEVIRKLADQGVAIVFASSEMPELIGLSDRIVVLKEGQVSSVIDAQNAAQDQIMEAASL